MLSFLYKIFYCVLFKNQNHILSCVTLFPFISHFNCWCVFTFNKAESTSLLNLREVCAWQMTTTLSTRDQYIMWLSLNPIMISIENSSSEERHNFCKGVLRLKGIFSIEFNEKVDLDSIVQNSGLSHAAATKRKARPGHTEDTVRFWKEKNILWKNEVTREISGLKLKTGIDWGGVEAFLESTQQRLPSR